MQFIYLLFGSECLQLVIIAVGGAVGALLRYAVYAVAAHYGGLHFPWGTLSVNVIGSFVIGFLWQWFERAGIVAPNWQTFLFVGVLGAFTTFSSYSLDCLRLVQGGQVVAGVLNIVVNNVLALTAVALGVLLARQLITL